MANRETQPTEKLSRNDSNVTLGLKSSLPASSTWPSSHTLANSNDNDTIAAFDTAGQKSLKNYIIRMREQYLMTKAMRGENSPKMKGSIINTPHPIGPLNADQTIALDLMITGFGAFAERIEKADISEAREEKYNDSTHLKAKAKQLLNLAQNYGSLDTDQLDNLRNSLGNAPENDTKALKETVTGVLRDAQSMLYNNIIEGGIRTSIIDKDQQQEQHQKIERYLKDRFPKGVDKGEIRSWVGSDADGFVPFSMAWVYVNNSEEFKGKEVKAVEGCSIKDLAAMSLDKKTTQFQYRTSCKAKKGAIGLGESLEALRDTAGLGTLSPADLTGKAFDEKYEKFKKYLEGPDSSYKVPQKVTAKPGTRKYEQAKKDSIPDTLLRAVFGPGEEMVMSDFPAYDPNKDINAQPAGEIINTLIFAKKAGERYFREKSEKTADLTEARKHEAIAGDIGKRAFLPLAEERASMNSVVQFTDDMLAQYVEKAQSLQQESKAKEAHELLEQTRVMEGKKGVSVIRGFFGPSDLSDDIGAQSAGCIAEAMRGMNALGPKYHKKVKEIDETIYGESLEVPVQYGQGTSSRRGAEVFFADAVRHTRQGTPLNMSAQKITGLAPGKLDTPFSDAGREGAIDMHQAIWKEQSPTVGERLRFWRKSKPKGSAPALWDALYRENPDALTPINGENINNTGARVKEGVQAFADQRAIPRADIAAYLGCTTHTGLPINPDTGKKLPGTDVEPMALLRNPQILLNELVQIASIAPERTKAIGEAGGKASKDAAKKLAKQSLNYVKGSSAYIAKALGWENEPRPDMETEKSRRDFVERALKATLENKHFPAYAKPAARYLERTLDISAEANRNLTENIKNFQKELAQEQGKNKNSCFGFITHFAKKAFSKITEIFGGKQSTGQKQENIEMRERISSVALDTHLAANAPSFLMVVSAAEKKQEEEKQKNDAPDNIDKGTNEERIKAQWQRASSHLPRRSFTEELQHRRAEKEASSMSVQPAA